MNVAKLIRLLAEELPTFDGDEDETPLITGYESIIPSVTAETDHRQYLITGVRRNTLGDVVVTLKAVG